MSVFPFQSNAVHTRNIRRSCTERYAKERGFLGVEHQPYLRHSQSSEARLDQLADEVELKQNKHYLHLLNQQHKSESSVVAKTRSNENIVTAFAKSEAWKLDFGSGDGLKLETIGISSTGNLSKR